MYVASWSSRSFYRLENVGCVRIGARESASVCARLGTHEEQRYTFQSCECYENKTLNRNLNVFGGKKEWGEKRKGNSWLAFKKIEKLLGNRPIQRSIERFSKAFQGLKAISNHFWSTVLINVKVVKFLEQFAITVLRLLSIYRLGNRLFQKFSRAVKKIYIKLFCFSVAKLLLINAI